MLAQARTRSFPLNEGGVCCVAAHLVDSLRGSGGTISVSGPRIRLGDEQPAEFDAQVVAAAQNISTYSRWERS